MEKFSLTEKIKAEGLKLGYAAVGITDAEEFTGYAEELLARSADYAFMLNGTGRYVEGAAPKNIEPRARSIIVLIYDFSDVRHPETLLNRIGRIYQARCYFPRRNMLNSVRLKLFEDFLKDNGVGVISGINIPQRYAAARAGLCTYGNNNFAYLSGGSSFICIVTLITDQELVCDPPTVKNICPKGCHLCQDACPTGALYAPRKLDVKKCIAFNNMMMREDHPSGILTSFIPHKIRENMGQMMHGCDICQQVCPRNRAALTHANKKDHYLEWVAERFDLGEILHMDEQYYRNVLYPITYNYIKDKRYFQRNAAIAIGNSKDPRYLPALKAGQNATDGMVREYVAWALGRIGTPEAIAALKERLAHEDEANVITEIKRALEASAEAS